MREFGLPPSGVLCAWAGAWLRGLTVPDEVLRASLGGHTRQAVHTAADTLPPADAFGTEENHTRYATFTPTSLVDVLTQWRRSEATVTAVFPVAGDVRGLAGPASFRDAALKAGQAVCGGEVGLVPELVGPNAASSAGMTLVWRSFLITRPPLDHVALGDASYHLTEAIRETASALAAAQVASRSPQAHAALREWRRASTEVDLPPQFPRKAVALVAQAERIQGLLDIVALDPVGGGVDGAAIRVRDTALRPLTEAVRRARVAGYNALNERA